MGFGSYDESEQEKRAQQPEEADVEVDEHGEGHDGESTFELEGSTDDMLDQLREIKENAAEAEE